MHKKTPQLISLVLIITLAFTSCLTTSTGNSGKLPPGQVKKVTGSKSAKPYAPGQRKKK